MARNCIIIVGIQIPNCRGDVAVFEEQFGDQLKFIDSNPQPNAPKFVAVNRFGGVPDDLPLYLAWKIFIMDGEAKLLSTNDLQELLQLIQLSDPRLVNIPPKYNNIIQSIVPDMSTLRYGVYIDYYDLYGDPNRMDSRYVIME